MREMSDGEGRRGWADLGWDGEGRRGWAGLGWSVAATVMSDLGVESQGEGVESEKELRVREKELRVRGR